MDLAVSLQHVHKLDPGYTHIYNAFLHTKQAKAKSVVMVPL